jgi:hypothetical protein
MNTGYVALLVTLAAVVSVSSIFAHTIAWIVHPIIGAMAVTSIYLTAYDATSIVTTRGGV